MTHTYTWRCTACPRPRTTVETTEDTPPVCPTCGKVMKTHDCCGVSGATSGPLDSFLEKYPDADSTEPLELGRHVYYRPMGVAVQEQLNMPAEIVDAIPGTYEYHHPDAVHFIKGPEPDDPTVPVFNTTNLERRLDVTERLVRELTERLYPVTAGDVETVVGGDCSPLGERVERLNGLLGRLLGGLDLP